MRHQATHANQLLAPYNRWAFHHETQLNPTIPVWRGPGAARPWEASSVSVEGFTYANRLGEVRDWDAHLTVSFADALVVLHRGQRVKEWYREGVRPQDLHAWASASKSLTGWLVADAVARGELDPGRTIETWLPSLAGTGFGDATLAQVLDGMAAVSFPDAETEIEGTGYARTMGWEAGPNPLPRNEYLALARKAGNHGARFTYRTTSTDVAAWVLTEVCGTDLATLTEERIWRHLGADRDAAWIVNPEGLETAGSGFLSTTRDFARFGQWVLDRGVALGQSAPGPGLGYSGQWWTSREGPRAVWALGYGGQMLFVCPGAELVVAQHSSFPTPTDQGQEFYAGMAGFPALAASLPASEAFR